MTKDSIGLSRWLGYLTEREVYALKSLVSMVCSPDAIIVNIGAGAGTSGLAIAEACPEATRYTIDISPGGPLGGLSSEYNAFMDSDIADKLPRQILGDSKAANIGWMGGKIDLIFIDGNHTKDGVNGDITAWQPHMKTGGIMAFHDYGSPNWKAIKPVVDRRLKGFEVVIHVDTLIGIRLGDKDE